MKQTIKRILRSMAPKKAFVARNLFYKEQQNLILGLKDRLWGIAKLTCRLRLIEPIEGVDPQTEAGIQFKQLIRKFRFAHALQSPYFYPLDPYTIRLLPKGAAEVMSLTLDNSKVLTTNLVELSKQLLHHTDVFSQSIVSTIDSIDTLRRRAIRHYDRSSDRRSRQIKSYLDRLMDTTPETLDEALQKILFFNALLWYGRQRHIGLGRLDLILQPYLERDLNAGVIDRAEAKQLLRNFVTTLGSHTAYKSVGLVGDTGQVILLSGTDRQGQYVENDITRMFIELIEELNIPDPKLILRVCSQTSPELWQRAIACVARGNGSPLMANEPKIMALMEQFGYDKNDVVDFGTSACWEPLIIGKSFDQNNSIENINLPHVVVRVWTSRPFGSYDQFESACLDAVTQEVERIARQNQTICFDRSPLHSIWMDGCVEQLTDIAAGGAKYNFHGFLAAGLPNTVNALLNIKAFVFDSHELSAQELTEVLQRNFEGNEPLRQRLLCYGKKFGLSDPDVLALTRKLMDTVAQAVAKSTVNGHKAKIGFSSPTYLSSGSDTPATPDGRKAGEPFATHISPVSHEVDFAQIIDFASVLDYSGNKINGNVVDFILSQEYAKNAEKFAHILAVAFEKGVFEMQLNVLNLAQLLAAKTNPALYPHLVVRVWGFSAYFNDLPESYKDHLIERARSYAA